MKRINSNELIEESPEIKKVRRNHEIETIEEIISNEKKYLSEEEKIGITQFLNSNTKFFGFMKKNYYDFIVNEVDLEKNVIRLTTEELPKEMIKKKEEKEEKSLNEEELKTYFDIETIEKIKNFHEKEKECLKKFKETNLVENDFILIPYLNEKEKRKQLHNVFKDILESDVFEKNDEKFIRLRYLSILNANKKRRDIQRFQSRSTWPKDLPEYLQFTLYKENKDTSMCLNDISFKLGFNIKVFSWAGTKDKKAITTQRITAYKVDPMKFGDLKIENLKIGDFKHVNEKLNLGDLYGNEFTIVLRDISNSISNEQIESGVKNLNQNGFINCKSNFTLTFLDFGRQRFGMNFDIPTYKVGIHVLKNEWEKAIYYYLKSKTNDKISKVVDDFFDEKISANDAYHKLPKFMKDVNSIFYCYRKSSNDHFNAFQSLPRNMRVMFLHSYQSLIWNKIVSKRIEKYGTKLIEGDIIEIGNEKIKILTKEDSFEKYSIFDLVFPLPGCDVEFPKNEFGIDFYNELLKQDEITLKDFEHHHKAYICHGTYRRVFSKPENLRFTIKNYVNENDRFVISKDIQKIVEDFQIDDEKIEDLKRALILSFVLPSSSYATMLMRELQNTASL
eukprot:gene1574-12699_t